MKIEYSKFTLNNKSREDLIRIILELQKEMQNMDERLKEDYKIIERLKARKKTK